jgi:hypothetical protein
MVGDVVNALIPDLNVISQWSVLSFCVAVAVGLGCWLARRIAHGVESVVVWLVWRNKTIDRYVLLDGGDE